MGVMGVMAVMIAMSVVGVRTLSMMILFVHTPHPIMACVHLPVAVRVL